MVKKDMAKKGDAKKRRRVLDGKLVLDGKSIPMPGGCSSVRALLQALEISPQEALVKVNGKIRPEGTVIGAKDKIEVIRVVFGG